MEKKSNLLLYVAIFLGTFLILQTFQGGKQQTDSILAAGDIGMKMSKHQYAVGKDIRFEIQNNTASVLTLPSRCPEAPVDVLRFTSEGYVEVEMNEERSCDRTEDIELQPGRKQSVSLQDYSYTLLGEPGRYKLELSTTLGEEEKTFSTPEFEIKNPSFITNGWRTLLYQPMLNLLVGILIYIPGHELWLGVILLTLLIRTILLVPSQRSFRAQKAMQDLQPKLDEIKKKYANDQARVAQETMMLWKTHKVSPFSSCLPLVIQMPILIALYFVIRTGLQPDQAGFIYEFLPEFHLGDINSMWLNFDLFDRSIIVFPLVVAGLQFIQMQFMTRRTKKAKKSSDGKKDMQSEMEMANNMMKYVMPIMIGVFTSQLPAAVGLYWGTSTLYGIIQQLVIHKGGSKTTSPTPSNDSDVKVRVINKRTKQ